MFFSYAFLERSQPTVIITSARLEFTILVLMEIFRSRYCTLKTNFISIMPPREQFMAKVATLSQQTDSF
jgi:hypothetical protein